MRPVHPLVLAAALVACGADPGYSANSADATGVAKPPLLPFAGGSGALGPWGGSDASRWRPEAVLANAASLALNEAWAKPDVVDAIVAVPVKLIGSGHHQFGDGQANAAASFEWWAHERPPVVATLVRHKSGSSVIRWRFDRALPIASGAFEIELPSQALVPLAATKSPEGDWLAEWTPPGELGLEDPSARAALLVHPVGWRDWFPIWFHFPVTTVEKLHADVPDSLRTFSDGGSIVDHEGVAAAEQGDPTPFAELSGHAFSPGYNQAPYQPGNIHAEFPNGGAQLVTGVGQGWTWVALPPAAPFKIMYTCFERRRADREASAPDGGVPSGSGWHRIGDVAETILHDLERDPLFAAHAVGRPLGRSVPGGGALSYNLEDVATFRWLMPGEAYVTRTGTSEQPAYHAYFIHAGRELCTEEWVHPCWPAEPTGFACALREASFTVHSATTLWGQDVRVAGAGEALGDWVPQQAPKLGPSSYPTWSGTVKLPAGAAVRFKFVKVSASGVVWEGGGDRMLSVPVFDATSFAANWK